ncbi:MAG: DUF4366 domain-containing protein [Lachnospiraceae bacterium]|nr:DUF4366 domain-containing protein [Lachnospiraceae bacterium]
MKKIFKTLVLTATTTGMLFMSIPVSALADAGDKGAVDPGKLISAEDLPKDAVVKGTERVDNTVYAYDEEGNLISTERVYSGEDESEAKGIFAEIIKDIPIETTGDGPLTPDGNMTLVDDYGDKPTAGKQFITLTTRSGAEFYLIIDRDDNGLETVHFLNKVDESDILAYMEEDEKTAFEERKTALEEEKAAFDSEYGEDRSDGKSGTDDKKVKDTGRNKNDTGKKGDEESTEANESSVIIVIIALAAGIASIVYIFVIKKKKGRSPKNAPIPEPDESEEDPDDFDEGPDDDSEIKEGDSDEDV